MKPLRGIAAQLLPPLFTPQDASLALIGYWQVMPGFFWQDTARTTPATQDGHTVASFGDRYGAGLYLIQATPARRPILRGNGYGLWWLAFDGIDDCLSIASVTLPVNRFSVSAAATLDAAGSNPSLASLSDSGFELRCSGSSKKPEVSNGAFSATAADALTLGTPSVLSAYFGPTGYGIGVRANGGLRAINPNGANPGTGLPFTIGARSDATAPWKGNVFGVAAMNEVPVSGGFRWLEQYLGKLGGPF